MPLPITKTIDYKTGVYQLPFSHITKDDLSVFIEELEPIYLDDLLGCELAELFIADCNNGVFTEPRFQVIYDQLCNESFCEYKRSLGIKIMLKGFIYFEYGRTLTNQLLMEGAQRSISENNTNVSQFSTRIIPNYNRSVDTYKAIQQYICDHKSDYPEFKGKDKNYSSPL